MTRLQHWIGGLPLRVRLVAAVTAIALLGLIIAGAATVTSLQSYLLSRVDSDLVQATQLANHGYGPGDDGNSRGPAQDDGQPPLPGQFWIQHYSVTGKAESLGTAPVLSASQPDLTTLTPAMVAGHLGRPFTVAGTSDSNWRVIATLTDDGTAVAVGEPLTGVHSTVDRLILLEVGIGLAVLLLMGGGGWFVVRRSLRPLAEVETTAAAIAAGDLSQRVPAGDERTEVGRLAAALNVMLGRIESAFASRAASERQARASEDRMRRFVADASHELRTPLTSIRGFAELHRMGAVADGEESVRMMGRIESESTRMGGLVEDLLTLARLDEKRPMRSSPVDLALVASDATHDAQVIAPDRRISFSASGTAVVAGDEERLHQVVHNLVGNALRHTPAGTPVEVSVDGGDDEVVLAVTDQGPGIEPEHIDHVFERFYRTDPARSRADGGSGLGLAIVAEIVAAHGGTVTVDSRPGEGARFVVRLPRS